MEKEKITVVSKKPVSFEYNGQTIKVLPYITPATELILLRDYVDLCFSLNSVPDSHQQAEWGLIMGIIHNQTSIPIAEDEDNVGLEEIVCSGIYEVILQHIANYAQLRTNLGNILHIIEEKIALEKSIGSIVQKISDKVFEFLDKISSMDLSEDGVKNLVAELQKVAKDYDDKFGITPKKPKKYTRKDLPQ